MEHNTYWCSLVSEWRHCHLNSKACSGGESGQNNTRTPDPNVVHSHNLLDSLCKSKNIVVYTFEFESDYSTLDVLSHVGEFGCCTTLTRVNVASAPSRRFRVVKQFSEAKPMCQRQQ